MFRNTYQNTHSGITYSRHPQFDHFQKSSYQVVEKKPNIPYLSREGMLPPSYTGNYFQNLRSDNFEQSQPLINYTKHVSDSIGGKI